MFATIHLLGAIKGATLVGGDSGGSSIYEALSVVLAQYVPAASQITIFCVTLNPIFLKHNFKSHKSINRKIIAALVEAILFSSLFIILPSIL